MSRAIETRPFNPDHAKAGAPYRTSVGEAATIFKWNVKNGRMHLAGIIEKSDLHECIGTWSLNGEYTPGSVHPYDLVMVPLGHIDGKPVFVGDEMVLKGTEMPHVVQPHDKDSLIRNLSWPAPAREYPKTHMLVADFDSVLMEGKHDSLAIHTAEAIANAALRHAIKSGQVVMVNEANANTLEHYQRGRGQRAVRDREIAKATIKKCVDACSNAAGFDRMRWLMEAVDIEAIVAIVTEP